MDRPLAPLRSQHGPRLTMEAVPKLETRSLSKTFWRNNSATEVLRGISFTVSPRQFVATVGASGCGKTTLLRIIDGLERPTSGSVLVDGKEVIQPGPDRGFVFQKDNLLPWRTVLKNVVFGLEIQKVPHAEASARALNYLGLVGLGGFENYYPHELSGGMQQRANLARALVASPEILLMDEPFAALDAQTRENMQSELLRIWAETEVDSILFITHQIDEALFLADKVLVLSSRPGQLRAIVDVDFPRPRDLSIKRSQKFVSIVDEVWHLIEEDAENREPRGRYGATDGAASGPRAPHSRAS